MNDAVDMSSGSIDRLSHSKVDGGGFTDRQHGDHISILLFLFFYSVVLTDRQQMAGSYIVNFLDLRSGGSRFQSRPKHWLFCLW
jgi:hypothetical protein